MTNTVRTPIVDKNGKFTHVHKKLLSDVSYRVYNEKPSKWKQLSEGTRASQILNDEMKRSFGFALFSQLLDNARNDRDFFGKRRTIINNRKTAEFIDGITSSMKLKEKNENPLGRKLRFARLHKLLNSGPYIDEIQEILKYNPAAMDNFRSEMLVGGAVALELRPGRALACQDEYINHPQRRRDPYMLRTLFAHNEVLNALFGIDGCFTLEDFDQYIERRNTAPLYLFPSQNTHYNNFDEFNVREIIEWSYSLVEDPQNTLDWVAFVADASSHGDDVLVGHYKHYAVERLILSVPFERFNKYASVSSFPLDTKEILAAIENGIDPDVYAQTVRSAENNNPPR